MKKTYIIPQTRVTKIHLQQMIALSTGGGALMDPDKAGYADADGDVLSRRGSSVWGDDED